MTTHTGQQMLADVNAIKAARIPLLVTANASTAIDPALKAQIDAARSAR